MVAPLAPYTLAAILWDQGENNVYNTRAQYACLYASMIADWRLAFHPRLRNRANTAAAGAASAAGAGSNSNNSRTGSAAGRGSGSIATGATCPLSL